MYRLEAEPEFRSKRLPYCPTTHGPIQDVVLRVELIFRPIQSIFRRLFLTAADSNVGVNL